MTLRREAALQHEWPLDLAVVRKFCGVWSETAHRKPASARSRKNIVLRDASAIS